VLLAKNIVVVEGLNLKNVPSGRYNGAILPIKISGGDGAPARAILWK
jgi:arylformamidase